MLELLKDEEIITRFDMGIVVLTTHRILYEQKEWGKSYNQSIMIEHITSCENHYESQIMFAILGAGGVMGGFIGGAKGSQEAFILSMGLGLVL